MQYLIVLGSPFQVKAVPWCGDNLSKFWTTFAFPMKET
jgi:hypothetical protein